MLELKFEIFLAYLPVIVLVRAVTFHPSPFKIFHPRRVRSQSEPVPFGTRSIPFCFSQLELVYFLLGLGWTGFRPDSVGTDTCDDLNTANGYGEDDCKNAKYEYTHAFIILNKNKYNKLWGKMEKIHELVAILAFMKIVYRSDP